MSHLLLQYSRNANNLLSLYSLLSPKSVLNFIYSNYVLGIFPVSRQTWDISMTQPCPDQYGRKGGNMSSHSNYVLIKAHGVVHK